MRRVVILGSTGSVGESAVRVAAALRDRIHVIGVVGNRNVKRLAEQAALLGCEFAATGSPVNWHLRFPRRAARMRGRRLLRNWFRRRMWI